MSLNYTSSIKSVEKRTFVHWIARWMIRWTVALRLILINSTGCIDTATSILAEIAGAEAGLVRIAVASRIACAFETVHSLSAFGVDAARSSQALISAW